MFPAFASLGMSVLQGWSDRGLTQAQNTVARAQADADNTIREGKNVERAATTALQQRLTAINNERKLRAGGQAFNAAQQSLARIEDSFTNGSIEDQISTAEAAGAYAANAASAGLGGSSVDAIDATMRLRAARKRFYTERQQGQVSYDAMQQIAGIVPQTIEGLDLSQFVSGVDYTHTLPQLKPVQGSMVADIVRWGLKNPDAAGSIQKGATGFFNPPPSYIPFPG